MLNNEGNENVQMLDVSNENGHLCYGILQSDRCVCGSYDQNDENYPSEDQDEIYSSEEDFNEYESGDLNSPVQHGSDHDASNSNLNDPVQHSCGHGTSNNSLVNIISKTKRLYTRLNASGLRLQVKFEQPDSSDIIEWLGKCISELLLIVEHELRIQPHDRVGIIFSNSNHAKVDFSLSFRPFSQYSTDSILFELEKVIQSNTEFFSDDNLVINVDHVRVPVGCGNKPRYHIGKSTEKYYSIHKRSMFSPVLNPEGLCLAVVIVAGKAYVSDDVNRYNFLTYNQNYTDLIKESRELCIKANVDLTHGGSIDEIIRFQNFLGIDYRIVVYASRNGKVILFKACHDGFKHTINILFDENHYSLILSPTAVFATAYFCKYCCIGYTSKLGHSRCRVRCNKCFQSPPCENNALINCSSCNREFANASCFQNHKNNKICDMIKVCQTCCTSYIVKKRSEHVCGDKYCKTCKTEMPIRHECYMAITKGSSKPKNGVLYVFYDFECYQTKDLSKNDPSKKRT